MTVQKTELEQAKAEQVKILRTAIRLQHTLNADRELNERLPEAEELFDRQIARGEFPDVTPFIRALNG